MSMEILETATSIVYWLCEIVLCSLRIKNVDLERE